MKEKRYIILEVDVETETVSTPYGDEIYLKDEEFARHAEFSDMLYQNTYGYVTRVSMLLSKDPWS